MILQNAESRGYRLLKLTCLNDEAPIHDEICLIFESPEHSDFRFHQLRFCGKDMNSVFLDRSSHLADICEYSDSDCWSEYADGQDYAALFANYLEKR